MNNKDLFDMIWYITWFGQLCLNFVLNTSLGICEEVPLSLEN